MNFKKLFFFYAILFSSWAYSFETLSRSDKPSDEQQIFSYEPKVWMHKDLQYAAIMVLNPLCVFALAQCSFSFPSKCVAIGAMLLLDAAFVCHLVKEHRDMRKALEELKKDKALSES